MRFFCVENGTHDELMREEGLYRDFDDAHELAFVF